MGGSLDPESVYRKSRDWEAAQPLSITFHALKTIFNPGGIDPYLWKDALPKIGRFENSLKNLIFGPGAEKKQASRARKFVFLNILKYREDLYFNPLRILDLISYFSPPRDFFIRRYGTRNPFSIFLKRCWRIVVCAFKVTRNVVDLAIYALIRFFRRENKRPPSEGRSGVHQQS
jgi:hypothetical protein